jgi:hypothetical protein
MATDDENEVECDDDDCDCHTEALVYKEHENDFSEDDDEDDEVQEQSFMSSPPHGSGSSVTPSRTAVGFTRCRPRGRRLRPALTP